MTYTEDTSKEYLFKVELLMNGTVFKVSYFATTLWSLSEQIEEEYPRAKVVSILGG